MFSTRHEPSSCEAISRAKSIPFLYYIQYSTYILSFFFHFYLRTKSCVSCGGATHHVTTCVLFPFISFSFFFFSLRFPDRNCGKRSVRACAVRNQVSVKPPCPCCVQKPHLENPNYDG